MGEPGFERVTFSSSAGPLVARAAGPREGEAVLLLHGFPEFWYAWRKQIPALVDAGYRVIALDQRGYNESAKPERQRDYALAELAADCVAVADGLQREKIHLVGHDWGGIVAWDVAVRHPERLGKMVILNAPHPAVARKYLTTSLRQVLRSWYIFFFQLPGLPEKLFTADHFAAGIRSLTMTSKPGAFTAEDLEQYRAAWAQPGAPRAMINWYRALARYSTRTDLVEHQVQVPTRILWGVGDGFLLREQAKDSLRLCTDGDLVEFPDATHWLHHEQPERVNAALLEHLQKR